MSNRKYGKNIEKLRNRVDARLVKIIKVYLNLASKSTFVSQKTFDNNFVAVEKIKNVLTFKKLAYVGMIILELSSTLFHQFHYDYIKNRYGNKA